MSGDSQPTAVCTTMRHACRRLSTPSCSSGSRSRLIQSRVPVVCRHDLAKQAVALLPFRQTSSIWAGYTRDINRDVWCLMSSLSK
jgi:hypothetical protein